MPETSGLDGRFERGWRKITFFQERRSDLERTVLFLDLDVAIVESLDLFFETPGDFRIVEDGNLRGTRVGNSFVFRFEIELRPGVLNYFLRRREDVFQGVGTSRRV